MYLLHTNCIPCYLVGSDYRVACLWCLSHNASMF